jgi:predicted membrane channel-forming protein YqfA (hemolysin III family)
MFVSLGGIGLVPGIHYLVTVGSQKAFSVGAFGWLLGMGMLYIIGACLYAARIPERLFPGKFDIWVNFFIYKNIKNRDTFAFLFFKVPKSSTFSCFCSGRCLRPLSRNSEVSQLSSYNRRLSYGSYRG